MSEWREVTLGDVVTLQRGFDITKKEQRPGSIPVVSSSGIGSFHDQAKVEPPGVVIGRKGSLGTVFFLHEPFWPHDTTLWVKDFHGNDPRYCSMLLKTLRLEDYDAGSSNPTLNRNHAHRLPVRVPEPATQRRIAQVVAAFDQLIEINERRIGLLEDLAHSLYREWLVHFRFPGHEHLQTVDSELGPIPEGWEVQPLHRVASVLMGQSPRSEFYNEEGDGLPFHQGVTGFGHLLPTHTTYTTVDKRVAERGDVLCSVRAPVGRMNISDKRLVIGRGLAAIRRTDAHQAFLLPQLRQALGEVDSLGGGTIYKAINKGQLTSLPVLEPPPQLVSRFSDTAEPALAQRITLIKQVRQLAATRDLLLPRLVTGLLDITDLDLGTLTPAEVQ